MNICATKLSYSTFLDKYYYHISEKYLEKRIFVTHSLSRNPHLSNGQVLYQFISVDNSPKKLQ